MANVQSILLLCTGLECYCHVVDSEVGAAADHELPRNQRLALTAGELWCLVHQRNIHGDGDAD